MLHLWKYGESGLSSLYGLTELLEWWMKERGIVIETEEEILHLREQFIKENEEQVYNQAVTLCHMHHRKLHNIRKETQVNNSKETRKLG